MKESERKVSKSFVKNLFNELPILENEKIVDPKTSLKLIEYYKNKTGAAHNYLLIVFSILAAILIGGGIILLFAYNWYKLPVNFKLMLTFLILILAQIGSFYSFIALKNQSRAWSEGFGAFWALSAGGSIALIGQILHLPSDTLSFYFTWAILVLPVIYFLRSISASIIYLGLIICWAGIAHEETGNAFLYWPMYFSVFPFYYLLWKNKENGLFIFLGYLLIISATISLGMNLDKCLPGLWIISYSGMFSVFYLIGVLINEDKKNIIQMPYTIFGLGGNIVLTFLFTYKYFWNEIGWHHFRYYKIQNWVFTYMDYIFTGFFILAAIALVAINLIHKKKINFIFPMILILSCAGYILASINDIFILYVAWGFNLYIAAMSIFIIFVGFKIKSLLISNLGLFIIVASVIARFFDSDLSLLTRGIVFIILGIVFIIFNLTFIKSKQNKELKGKVQ